MGCFGRIGCLVLGMLVGGLALAACLATRHAGPSYEDGVYTYNAGGRHKAVRLSSEAARRFDAKVAGDIPESRLPEAVLRGVPITEEELNSRVAEELARQPIEGGDARVERVFIRLRPSGARAYVYTDVRGVGVVLSSDLVFRLEGGKLEVELRDPEAGRLPLGFVLSPALAAIESRTGLERTIAVVMPPQVRAFSYEEGQLRVLINPLAR